MPDEQIPEQPPSEEPEEAVVPPPIERKPPRVLGGWIASGLMFFLAIMTAVYGYFDGFSGERSFTQLQETFATQVSFAHGLPESFEETGESGIRSVMNDALKDAAEHEEAARVAVVAAYELGEEPDEGALETLVTGKDQISRDVALLYTHDPVNPDIVELFTAYESDEFAVKLAQVHAREMIGEDGGRDAFLDKSMAVKSALIMVGVGLGGAGGALCLVLFFAARSAGRLRPVGFAGTTVWDGDRLMVRFAFYMIGFAFIGYGVSQVLGKISQISDTWIGAIALMVVTAFVIAVLYVPIMDKADGLKGIIGGRAQDFWKNVGIGLYGYLCTVPVLIVVLMVVFLLGDIIPQPTHPISEEMTSASPFDWIAIALTASLLAPFLEELAFRGLLFPALGAQLKRPLWAILACGFLFAAIHPQGPMIWPALMMIGGVAAYVRYYTGSLVPSFVIHFVHNSVIVATAYLVT